MVREYTHVIEKSGVDCIMAPTATGNVPKISDVLGGQEVADPVEEYLNDYYTVVSNTLGIPATNIPIPVKDDDEFPSSVRLMGYYGEDYFILKIA